MKFVNTQERNLLAAALDLVDLGLAKKVEPHQDQLREDLPPLPSGETESFYELTDKGRIYFNRIVRYASESVT
jgi:hypothetical protein|tara:strand:- start:10 stop:228 length:219 start_codon:yes stop_codon:yes gene_type:complete